MLVIFSRSLYVFSVHVVIAFVALIQERYCLVIFFYCSFDIDKVLCLVCLFSKVIKVDYLAVH
jgi:hypothetical protein